MSERIRGVVNLGIICMVIGGLLGMIILNFCLIKPRQDEVKAAHQHGVNSVQAEAIQRGFGKMVVESPTNNTAVFRWNETNGIPQ